MESPLYEPWTWAETLEIPTPYAKGMGVPVEGIALTAAAATPERVLITAQVAAFVNMKIAEKQISAAREQYQQEKHSSRPTAEFDEPTFEGPLVRFECPKCGDEWDAWIDDDGHLEDKRDLWCSSKHSAVQGVEIIDD